MRLRKSILYGPLTTPVHRLRKDRNRYAILHTRFVSTASTSPPPPPKEAGINWKKKKRPHIKRIIKPQPPLQPINLAQLPLTQIPPRDIQILLQPPLIITLRNDRHAPLRRPPQQDLRGALPLLLRDLRDHRALEQKRRVFRLLHIQLEEGLRAEGGIGSDGDVVFVAEMEEVRLAEVRVMFDLQSLRLDPGVAEEVQHERAGVVADADAPCQALVYQLLHCLPGALQRRGAGADLVVFVGEAGGVANRGVDVFEGDGEVDNVEVKVVDVPVCELFLADGGDALGVVEGVPEFGDEEEVGAFD